MEENNIKYKTLNIPLLVFDIILLPINIVRMIIIYFCGSKYNLRGFQFLDVIMHADNPYFNQDDCRIVNTIGTDYRVVIREDSRIFPMDINKYIDIKRNNIKEEVTVGNTIFKKNTNLDIGTYDINIKPPSESKVSYDEKHEIFIEGINSFRDTHKEYINKHENHNDIINSIRNELNNIFET